MNSKQTQLFTTLWSITVGALFIVTAFMATSTSVQAQTVERDLIQAESAALNLIDSENFTDAQEQIKHCYGAFGLDPEVFSKRNIQREQEAVGHMMWLFEGDLPEERQAIKMYLTYDFGSITDVSMNQRVNAVAEWQELYNKKQPTSRDEWKDLLLLANGFSPETKSKTLEESALERFTDVYGRLPQYNTIGDALAMNIASYGIQIDERNIQAEQQALTIYANIYDELPSSRDDWNIVHAIAYSGATR